MDREEQEAMAKAIEGAASMRKVLDRTNTLRGELAAAANTIRRLTDYISPNVYIYNSQKKCVDLAKEAVDNIDKVLGV